jgi:hypothetical protein
MKLMACLDDVMVRTSLAATTRTPDARIVNVAEYPQSSPRSRFVIVGASITAVLGLLAVAYSAWGWTYAGSQSTVPACQVGECAFDGIGEAWGWFVGVTGLAIGVPMVLTSIGLVLDRRHRTRMLVGVAAALLAMPLVAYGVGVTVGY